MPLIPLTTSIQASPTRCFDLSRSIDLHKLSTSHTKEQAIAGKTSGLIAVGRNSYLAGAPLWCLARAYYRHYQF